MVVGGHAVQAPEVTAGSQTTSMRLGSNVQCARVKTSFP